MKWLKRPRKPEIKPVLMQDVQASAPMNQETHKQFEKEGLKLLAEVVLTARAAAMIRRDISQTVADRLTSNEQTKPASNIPH